MNFILNVYWLIKFSNTVQQFTHAHILTVQAWSGYWNTSWSDWVGDWVGGFYLLLLLLLRLKLTVFILYVFNFDTTDINLQGWLHPNPDMHAYLSVTHFILFHITIFLP